MHNRGTRVFVGCARISRLFIGVSVFSGGVKPLQSTKRLLILPHSGTPLPQHTFCTGGGAEQVFTEVGRSSHKVSYIQTGFSTHLPCFYFRALKTKKSECTQKVFSNLHQKMHKDVGRTPSGPSITSRKTFQSDLVDGERLQLDLHLGSGWTETV